MAADYTADPAESLRLAYQRACANLAEFENQPPKPNYTIDGESYNWGDLRDKLYAAVAQAKQMLADAEGPIEHLSYGEA